GLGEAAEQNVLIYIHKETELDDIAARYPANHYVLVDDKVRILSAFKRAWANRVTTVFPRQGHYALDAQEVAKYPPADLCIDRIGLMLQHDLPQLVAAGKK
ncbi:MAG: HAD family hydrolase, partial [Candidatus Binataceae bacterium]